MMKRFVVMFRGVESCDGWRGDVVWELQALVGSFELWGC